MLTRIDNDQVILPFQVSADEPGLRLLDRWGKQRWVDVGGLRGLVKAAPDGKLVLDYGQGISLIDPAHDFARIDVAEWNGNEPEPSWDMVIGSSVLVGTASSRYLRVKLDRPALNLPDPGYSEPIEGTLLPGKDEIAVSIVRCEHIAIYNFRRKTTELVTLAGRRGSAHGVVREGELWLTNYDTLCAINLETRTVRASSVLQPLISEPQYGMPTSAFVGVPKHVASLNGWLVPRPYSGDIVLVDKDTMKAASKIAMGGKPYDLALFDDGTLLVIDHPFNGPRFEHIRNLIPMQ